MDKETIKEIRMAIQENRVDDFKRMASENSDTLEVVTFFGTFLHDAASYRCARTDVAGLLEYCLRMLWNSRYIAVFD